MDEENKNIFDWIPIYEEIGKKLINYETNRKELIRLINEMKTLGLKTIPLKDKDKNKNIKLSDIDPFTFFSNFNRGIRKENRIKILTFLKEKFNLKSHIPNDFKGIPTVNNMKSWFFSYKRDRTNSDIDNLWRLFLNIYQVKEDTELKANFDEAIKMKNINYNLTIGLYWVSPYQFIPLDKFTKNFLTKKLSIENKDFILKKVGFQGYLNIINLTRKKFQNKKFPNICYEAWEIEKDKNPTKNKENKEKMVGEDITKLTLNTILYGPPGTGKTFITKQRAVKIIEGDKNG